MKTILKSIITASLLLASVTTTAQNVIAQDLESWMETILCQADERKVEVSRNIGHERDVQKEGTPLKWRRDIITLTLPKKHRNLLDDMIRAFESNAQYNPKCYGVNSQRGSSNGNTSNSIRRMMYGDFPMDYVEIGKDYTNYINVNILDAKDTTKTHRYAYALEWRETSETSEKGAIDVRYIITYGKIPTSPYSSLEVIKKSNKDAIESYKGFIKGLDPKNVYHIKNARFQWNGKDYPIEKIDSVFRDAEKRGEQISKNLQKAFIKGNSVVVWADSIDHDNDPVTDVVLRLQQGEDVTVNDLLCNDNILLILSQLKQQYLAGQNTEFNAISIYTLCRKAYDGGFFSDSHSFEELEQIICEVDKLTEKAKTETDRKYFQMAREQLDKILKSRK